MKTLVERILELSAERPDAPALAFKKEQLTYAQLADKIRAIAGELSAIGIKAGNRVLFTALSKPEMAAVYLGIQYIGGVAVFVDKNSTAENAVAIYEDARASLFLTDKPMKEYGDRCRLFSMKQLYAASCAEHPVSGQKPVCAGHPVSYHKPAWEDIAELLFTTGTTGKPKGVMLSYRAVYHILSNTIEGIGIREDERVLIPLPLNHSFALRVLRAVLYQGALAVLQNGFAFAKETENNQSAFDCTAFVAVPASIEILRGQMQDRFVPIMSRFRYIEIGAGSLTVAQRKRLTAELPDTTIYNTWGSSESGGALFTNVTVVSQDEEKIKTIGKPLSHVQVAVLDEHGAFLNGVGDDGDRLKVTDKDHPGRLALRGDMQMSGYWNMEELTAQTLRDGWLITSDMVYTDADGYVYMLGRADDIINVGGEKVSPIEVENVAGQYESVRECACIGVPDPNEVLGQVPVLYLAVNDAGFSEAGIQTFLAQRMERYKLPAQYVVVENLPRNRMGKIDRKAIRQLWEQKGADDRMNPVMQALLTRRSIRRFTDRKIEPELLEMILRAGYYAPTGHNMQTWRFTVIQKTENIEHIKQVILERAAMSNVHVYGFENPACLILISNDVRNPNGCQDASCAAENIFLAAHSYGIGSTWLNPLFYLWEDEVIRELLRGFGVPEGHRVWCMAALGYPVAPGAVLAKKKDVVFYAD